MATALVSPAPIAGGLVAVIFLDLLRRAGIEVITAGPVSERCQAARDSALLPDTAEIHGRGLEITS